MQNESSMEQINEELESTPRAQPIAVRPMNMAATLAICSGGWLVPGLSHILIGRWIRGLIFAACVLLMFAAGIGMHGKLYDLDFQEPLQAPSYDYGTTYLWVCGLLNYLIVLDAFDIAQGRRP
ncbi:MAG: hypothetical protein DMG12_18150 [Acidobacteria bacterium]|nr:MAG: hypothetical protein DMG12_18150 [Acidobacteriota bacterium]